MTLSDILAVVVVYERDLTDIPALRLRGVDLLIYDNSPAPHPVDGISATYVHDPTNPGVSRAYNVAAARARQTGRRWLLLLDQDTSITTDDVERLVVAAQAGNDRLLVAPVMTANGASISPARQGRWRNTPIPVAELPAPGLRPLRGTSLINSGLLVPLSLIDEAGGWNDAIRLDFSDTYFVERCRRVRATYVQTNVVIQHDLSGVARPGRDADLRRFGAYVDGAREFDAAIGGRRGRRLASVRAFLLARRHRSRAPLRVLRRYGRA